MSDDSRVVRVWSENELDRALSELRRDVPVNADAVPAAQAKLVAAIHAAASENILPTKQATPSDVHVATTGSSRSSGARPARHARWTRPLVAIPLLAALLIGGLIVPTIRWSGSSSSATANAAEYLHTASQKASASAATAAPGEYTHVKTRAWWSAFNGDYVFLNENLIQTWVPADLNDEWTQTREATTNRIWIAGTEAEARRDGVLVDGIWPSLNERARCGDFDGAVGGVPDCSASGSWQRPTADFIAGLPTTAAGMSQRLSADVPDNGSQAATELAYAADALTSGALPPATTAVLYDAMAAIPGIEVTEDQANLDGQLGTAFGIENGDVRFEVIIDRTTGDFIGQRQVLTDSRDAAPSGTTITYTSVTRQIVDTAGAGS